MDYYLRYATYAMVAGSMDVLDERVLQGLRETLQFFRVPIGPTIRYPDYEGMVKEQVAAAGEYNFVDEPFDYADPRTE